MTSVPDLTAVTGHAGGMEAKSNPLYYATDAEFRAAVEQKRDFDPNVGGGVDRDKIPDGDFAGPHRSLPIVTPKDVHDAWIRANTVNGGDIDEMHRRITAIAKRKGQAFVDQLPDTAKSEKSWLYLGDSFEGKQALLSDALDRWMDQMFPSAMTCSWVEATYPDFALVGVTTAGIKSAVPEHIEFWKVPYAIGEDESVTLSEPSFMDIKGVAIDRPGDASDDIVFLPRENVVAKALAYKSASRQRRHYALLAHQGVDISATGLTAEQLAVAPNGTATIPAAGDADYRTGQSDLSTPGSAGPEASNTQVPGQGNYLDDAGNMPGRPVPEWYQGTYYVDNESNLVPAAVPGQGDYRTDAGNMGGGAAVPAQGNYLDGANSNLPAAGVVTEVGTSRDAGSLTLASRQNLIRQVKAQRYRIPGAPVADPTSAMPTEADARLWAALPDIAEKAVALAIACKEGRLMSGGNGSRIASLHSELGRALKDAGAPIDVFDATNTQAGMDEEGVPITPQEAKGLPMEQVMAFQRLRAEMAATGAVPTA